jgi:copper resistance protein C
MSIRIFVPALSILALLFVFEPILRAHAILLEAVPAKDAVVSGMDITVQLKFNSRVDGPRSKIILVLPDKSQRTLFLIKQTLKEFLNTRPFQLSPGLYRVRWQVLAVDGHITRGEYSFNVR